MDKHSHFNAWTHTHTQIQTVLKLLVWVFRHFHICLSYPHTQQDAGRPRGTAPLSMALPRWRQHLHPRTLWHPYSPLTRRKEWRELHERFTNQLRWSPLEAEWRPVVVLGKGGREFQGESWSVWSVILYSEERFSILLLNSDQSHRGFHQASVTPWILQIAPQ